MYALIPFHQRTEVCGEFTGHHFLLPDARMPASSVEQATVGWGEVEAVNLLFTGFLGFFYQLVQGVLHIFQSIAIEQGAGEEDQLGE